MLLKYRRCPACGAPVAISTVLRAGVRGIGERNIKCEACGHTISRIYETDKFGFAVFYLVLTLGGLLLKIFGEIFGVESHVSFLLVLVVVALITSVILVVGFYHFLPFSDLGE